MTTTKLDAVKRLHDLGFGIHLLKPRSKAPIEFKWTKGPRKTWAELKKNFRDEMNIGVRLGEASRFFDGTFLAVIDCDVKGTDERHRREMEARLKADFPGVGKAPVVLSGRGNGSRHIYVRTRTPIAPYRHTQSGTKVRVKMPTHRASEADKRVLDAREIADGYRVRAAWEISVMGQGQQVVLPPSIHPDTGLTYAWGREIKAWVDAPIVDIAGKTARNGEGVEREAVERDAFKAVDVCLVSSDLPESTVALIVKGVGCRGDRSASMFAAAIAMIKARMSDAEILSVLTDRSNFLGECAYDHTGSGSRARAAEWVRKFTVAPARKLVSADTVFAEAVVVSDLDARAAEAQAVELGIKATGKIEALDGDWLSQLERTSNREDARPKMTLQNVHLILTKTQGADFLKRNLLLYTDSYARDTAWGGKRGEELKDIDLVLIKFWLAENFRLEPHQNMILEALQKISNSNSFHPIRDYLNGLEWDGVDRLDNWLVNYLGADGPKEYLRDVGRKMLVAMVARVMDPGHQYDCVPVLEGPQGCGKSTAVRILAEPWFSDAMINVGDKDAVMTMRLAWVVELGELSTMRKADLESLKQFITQRADRIRVPYGRLVEAFQRQSVFIGTTNSSEYLKDTTGNRRFWPIKMRQCRFDELERDRNQLLAEAKVFYDFAEPVVITDPKVKIMAVEEQNNRLFIDEWVGVLDSFLANRDPNFPKEKFTISDLFSDFGPFKGSRDTQGEQQRAASALKCLGYSKIRLRNPGERKVYWVKPDENSGHADTV